MLFVEKVKISTKYEGYDNKELEIQWLTLYGCYKTESIYTVLKNYKVFLKRALLTNISDY